jgi:hypothetical protein
MVSAISTVCVLAIVLALVLILRVILLFHQEGGAVEVEIGDEKNRGSL